MPAYSTCVQTQEMLRQARENFPNMEEQVSTPAAEAPCLQCGLSTKYAQLALCSAQFTTQVWQALQVWRALTIASCLGAGRTAAAGRHGPWEGGRYGRG